MYTKSKKITFCTVFLLLAITVLMGAGYHAWQAVDFYCIKNSVEAEAVITKIDTIEKRRADAHNVYVSFELSEGVLHTSLLDTYAEGMEIGDSVKIVYNMDNPDEVILWWSSPLLAVVLGGVGILLLAAAIIIRKKEKRKLSIEI